MPYLLYHQQPNFDTPTPHMGPTQMSTQSSQPIKHSYNDNISNAFVFSLQKGGKGMKFKIEVSKKLEGPEH